MIDITKSGVVKSVNHYNLVELIKFTNANQNTYQAVLEGYDNAITITESEYNAFLSADYSQGGGGSLEGAITSDTISNMEYSENKLTIDGSEMQFSNAMVYNTETHKLSGAKDQSGNDVTFAVGTITITI